MDDKESKRKYYLYRRTIERVEVEADSMSEAWKKGKELLGPPLVDIHKHKDRYMRIRMKLLRGIVDCDKE